MKTLGIVGGIGPESTVEYYRSIIRQYRKVTATDSSPGLVIKSIDVKVLLDLVQKELYEQTVIYVGEAITNLAGAGADFAILAANTPHIVFDNIRARSPIPLLSIVEATCEAAKVLQINKAGLIGTRFTMRADFYQSTFATSGMEVIVPRVVDQDTIHEIYVEELLNGKFLRRSQQRLLRIFEDLIRDHKIEGILLAGTELPLILEGIQEVGAVPLLDTTQIHVHAAVAEILR